MSTQATASVLLDIRAREILLDGIKAGSIPHDFRELLDLPNGTSDLQIDRVFSDRQTSIGASVTTVYELSALTTTLAAAVTRCADSEGTNQTFGEVVLIAIRNRSSTTANVLLVGPDATNGFGVLAANRGFWNAAADRNAVQADSWVVFYSKAGVPVTDASAEEIAIITAAATTANTWDILVLGRST
jgi:hypothetical protein